MKINAYVKSIETNDDIDVIDLQRVHVAIVDDNEEGDPFRAEIVISISIPKDGTLTLQQLKEEAIETALSHFKLTAASLDSL